MNKPKALFGIMFDFILPKNKNDVEAENVTIEVLSKKLMRNNKTDAESVYTLFDYRDKSIKNMVWSLKYRRNRKVAKLFSQMLYDFLIEELSDLSVYSDFNDPLLIPIPLSNKRLRKRGFNQSELLAKELCIVADKSVFTLRADILKKIKDTPSQTLFERKARLKNIIGSFGVVKTEVVKNRNVILLDDVTTTGATLSEARKVLLNAGAKNVICVTVAH